MRSRRDVRAVASTLSLSATRPAQPAAVIHFLDTLRRHVYSCVCVCLCAVHSQRFRDKKRAQKLFTRADAARVTPKFVAPSASRGKSSATSAVCGCIIKVAAFENNRNRCWLTMNGGKRRRRRGFLFYPRGYRTSEARHLYTESRTRAPRTTRDCCYYYHSGLSRACHDRVRAHVSFDS